MLRAVNDRIIIKVKAQKETTSASGLILSAPVDQRFEEGVVVSVGEGRFSNGFRSPPCVSVNDKVLFTKNTMLTLREDGEDFVVLREEDIIAVRK